MLIIGVILILLAVAVIAYVVLATAGMTPVEISYGPLNVEVEPLWLYLAGVLTLAVAALGLWMAVAGARSKARRAREVRELRKQAADADRRGGRPTTTDRRGAVGGPTTSTGHGTTTRPGTTPGQTERNRLEPDR